ncbi:MAG: arabinogalactan endo,4-beta-galactosidase [Micromonosporaceae bacterium]
MRPRQFLPLRRRSLLLAAPAIGAGTVLFGASPATAGAAAHPRAPRLRGADLSFTPQLEAAGVRFRDRRGVRPVERILADHGANYIRLRVWTNPPAGYSTEATALAMARRAHRAGLRILLDVHYSDFWADPGHQNTPAAWQGQDLPTLASTVRRYTRGLVADFARQGTPLDMVQVGNEITGGMLWPLGQIYQSDGAHWTEFTTLLNAGIAGVREGSPRRHPARVMVHIDRGGDNGGSVWFYDHVLAAGVVDFDVIGLSYYPFWHGSFAALQANLNDLAPRYGRDLVVVETAYPWTLGNGDQLANFIDSVDQLPDGAAYPATPQGQAGYFGALRQILAQVPGGRGAGFFTWEPEWIPGVGWEPGAGNPNDNLTQFDWQGNALPSVDAYRPG